MQLPIKYKGTDWRIRKQAREQYIEEQNNLCYFCKESLSRDVKTVIKKVYPLNMKLFPNGMLKYPIHLHHNHNTNLTIGAVHAYCNCVLWQYGGE